MTFRILKLACSLVGTVDALMIAGTLQEQNFQAEIKKNRAEIRAIRDIHDGEDWSVEFDAFRLRLRNAITLPAAVTLAAAVAATAAATVAGGGGAAAAGCAHATAKAQSSKLMLKGETEWAHQDGGGFRDEKDAEGEQQSLYYHSILIFTQKFTNCIDTGKL